MGLLGIFTSKNYEEEIIADSNIMNIKSENRSNQAFMDSVQQGQVGGNGISVSEDSVLKIPSANCCLEIITGSIATLDVELYKRNIDGDIEKVLGDKRLFLLNNEPNEIQSAYNFKKALAKDFILQGKAFTKVEWSKNEVQELHNLPATRVTLNKYYDGYKTKYNVKYQAEGGGFDFDADEVMCMFKDSANGIDSVGLLTTGRDIFKIALAELQYSENVMSNGALPIGILSTTGRLSKEAVTKLRNSWQNLYSRGSKTAASTVVLEEGMKYEPISLSPQALDLSGARKTTTAEVARLFNVPLSLVDASANKYNSLVQNNLHYLQYCLFPIITAMENAFNKYLLLEDEKQEYFFKFNTSAVLQSTDQEKFEALNTAVSSGLLSVNEARNKLNMNALDNNFFKWTLGAVLYNPENDDVVIPNLGMATTLEKMKETQEANLNKTVLESEKIQKEIEENGQDINSITNDN